MKEPLLVALVALFVVVMIFRLIKSYLLANRLKGSAADVPSDADDKLVAILKTAESPQKAKEAVQAITHAAVTIETPAARGAYFAAAGNLAVNQLKRPNLAVGLYLRALRVNPTCVEAVHRLQEILTAQKRIRRLEWTYWEVLSRLDDSEVGEEMWIACWAGLAALYAASPKTVHRADAIRKSLSAFVSDDSDEVEIERISRIPEAVR